MATIDELIAQLKAKHEAAGTSVRCPVCNAGAGRWCLRDGITIHRSATDIVIHAERVALAKSEGAAK